MNMSKRVVIIERDPEWRQFVAKVLARAGYDVSVLTRGMPIDDHPALFLVDGSMVEYVNRLVRGRKQFVIFDNAPTIPNAVSAYRIGALDYVGKTFNPELLLRAVTEAQDKHSVRLSATQPIQNGNHAPPMI